MILQKLLQISRAILRGIGQVLQFAAPVLLFGSQGGECLGAGVASLEPKALIVPIFGFLFF
jgi:hypothetical protein